MSKRPDYVFPRGGMFLYRRRVPADVVPVVGVKWWNLSLRTRDESEAARLARKLAVTHDDLIAEARGKTPTARQAAVLATLTARHEKAEEQAAFAWGNAASMHGEAKTLPAARKAEQAAEKIRRAMLAAAEQRLDTLPEAERAAIQEAGGLDAFFQRTMSETNGVEVDRIMLETRRNLGAVTPRKAETESDSLNTRARFAAKDRATLVKLKLTAPDGFDDPRNPLIKTAVARWFEAKKQGSDAVKRHRVAINRFVEMHGNVAVGSVTKDMCRSYLKRIENLPDHRRLPANQRGTLEDPGPDVPRVSAKTVERHLITIKALLTFCVEQDWLTANVATGLHPPKDTRPKASKRRPFTREERRTLLNKAIEESGENGDMPWLIKLGAYSGARIEELAQLSRSNVRQVDGVWVVEFDDLDGRNLKTTDSVRMLPLHPAIRDDFVAWVESGNGARIFRSFRAGKDGRFRDNVSGDFARLMDRAGLTDPRLVFHSFRHTFKRETSNARLDPDVRRALIGHAPKDAHDAYAGPSLEAIAAEFARLPPLF